MIFSFGKASILPALIGRSDRHSQRVLLETSVIAHVDKYRQRKAWSTEAGGQLFGSIDSKQITVALATGPYRGDERSRYRYRSRPEAAQDAIKKCAAQGLLYLGEWHTHAEDQPDASSLDSKAMRLLLGNSVLNTNSLLLLIIGRLDVAEGIGLWTVARDHVFDWKLVASEV